MFYAIYKATRPQGFALVLVLVLVPVYFIKHSVPCYIYYIYIYIAVMAFHFNVPHIHNYVYYMYNITHKVGIGIKPGTPVENVLPYVDQVDTVLIMTVEPGFGGQSFMADMMPKVELLRQKYPGLDIEVDGGLSPKTIDTAAKVSTLGCLVSCVAFVNLRRVGGHRL